MDGHHLIAAEKKISFLSFIELPEHIEQRGHERRRVGVGHVQ